MDQKTTVSPDVCNVTKHQGEDVTIKDDKQSYQIDTLYNRNFLETSRAFSMAFIVGGSLSFIFRRFSNRYIVQ